uniref:Uncharacterized protein n=1 Tax=Arundo donax TaxID=35708 RepID=A0A0A9GVW8_ARUDO
MKRQKLVSEVDVSYSMACQLCDTHNLPHWGLLPFISAFVY